METSTFDRARKSAVTASPQLKSTDRYLNTAQAAHEIGMSKSWVEKGRIYGYGPPFIQLKRSGSKAGPVRYRLSGLQRWMEEQQCLPEEARHG